MSVNKSLMIKAKVILSGLLFLGTSNFACASTADEVANIKSLLEKRTPPIKAKSVQPTPLAGLYEVYSNGIIYYMDKSTKYVLVGGSLVDDSARINLTAQRLKELSSIDFKGLPLQNAIEIKKGTGAYKFAVFTDPDCPYCKVLEKDLAESKITDYTVYVFLYPLKHLHPDAAVKAESIWCAKDKAKVWHNWMLEDTPPPQATCDNPLTANAKLAEDLGVNGTPSIYLQDGKPAQNLEELSSAIIANN